MKNEAVNETSIKSQRNLNKLYKYEKIYGCGILLGAFVAIIGSELIGDVQNSFAKFCSTLFILILNGGFIVFCLTFAAHFILLGLGYNEQIFIFRPQECLLKSSILYGNQIIKYTQFLSVYLDAEKQIKFVTENRVVIGKFSLSAFSNNEIERILLEFRKRSKKIQIASALRKEYAIKPDIKIEGVKPAKPSMPQPDNPSPHRKRNIISASASSSMPQNTDENISHLKTKRRLEL